jgi:hypothetical protein
MLDSAPNLVAVQKYLQHGNLSSTHRYVRADIKSLAQQFNRITQEHFKDVVDIVVDEYSDLAVTVRSPLTRG